ncbi:MAG: uracil-DNA glycosylase [Burkholderiales bacterium]|nr:uracil-DNA glycosylase [Burkholderiales bacterium]
MGVGPLWKQRVAGDAPAKAASMAPSVPVAAGAAQPPADPDAPRRVREAATRQPDPAPDGDARAQAILAMDWQALREAVAGCTACSLSGSRRNTVFGVGNERAAWMIIGEAPGAEEDARGEPFVGQAGQLLDAMLGAIGLSRKNDVFIANVLKCRPPGNRNPEPAEVARCLPHLMRQVALVRPGLILLMGRFAAHAMLATDASIASLRGRLHRVAGTPAIVTYHPAYLLRTPLDKARAWQDLVLARATWQDLQSARASPTSSS